MSDIFDCMTIELDEKVLTGRDVMIKYCLTKLDEVNINKNFTQTWEIEFLNKLIQCLSTGNIEEAINRGCPTSYGLGVEEVEPCGSFGDCDTCWEHASRVVVER